MDWLIRLIKGTVVGIGAILPGLSGGVMAVIFGIYDPLIHFLADFRKDFMKNVRFFLPIFIGVGLGIRISRCRAFSICLFMSLISFFVAVHFLKKIFFRGSFADDRNYCIIARTLWRFSRSSSVISVA